ncbi:MAG: effector-associated domain EAD1-containing protein [Bacteroidota bacterium]
MSNDINSSTKTAIDITEALSSETNTIDNEYRRDLRIELARLFPTIEEAKLVLSDSGVSMHIIAFNTNPQVNWHNIIINTENNGRLREMIDAALSMYKDNQILKAYRSKMNTGL